MKKEFNPDFLIIPFKLVADDKLQPVDLKVFGIIYWYERLKDGKCTASNESIAKQAHVSEGTVANSLIRLEERKYIKRVFKDKEKARRTEIITNISFKGGSSDSELGSSNDELGSSDSESRGSSNDEQISNILEKNNNTAETGSAEVVEVIDLFAVVNPSYQKWYANTTQREAVKRILKVYGLDQIKKVVDILPKSNNMPYVPTITTPVQLEEKWPQLAAALIKKKAELTSKHKENNYIL